MSVGIPVDKATLDSTAGRTVVQLHNVFEQVQVLKDWLDGKTDAELEALNYTTEEINLLRSAYTDLSNLGKVAHGELAQTPPNNFFFFADHLTGIAS